MLRQTEPVLMEHFVQTLKVIAGIRRGFSSQDLEDVSAFRVKQDLDQLTANAGGRGSSEILAVVLSWTLFLVFEPLCGFARIVGLWKISAPFERLILGDRARKVQWDKAKGSVCG